MSNPYHEMRKMSVADICKGLGWQTLLFVCLGMFFWLASGRLLTEFVTVDVRQIAIGLGLGFGMIAVAFVVFQYLTNLSEKLVRLQAKNFAFLEKQLPLPAIVFISICAGVGEEAIFRGGLQTILSDFTPLPVAIILSSIVFALIHFAKPVVAFLILLIGVIFGIFYVWTGSLLAVMIGHAVYDVYALWFLQKEMHRLKLFDEIEEEAAEQPLEQTGNGRGLP
ncbi:MAG: CPBP family intramembrane glutamic endopeptidase [Erythrobacter sp.]